MRLIWNAPTIPQKMQAEHYSNAPYSSVVVFGAYRKDGSIMPAHDFIGDAIAQTEFVEPFKNVPIPQAFDQINQNLHINIKLSIQSSKWNWDRLTYRRNKSIVGSPRDIVDTGELLNSQVYSIK